MRIPPLSRMVAESCLRVAVFASLHCVVQADVPVPQPTFTSTQLYQPLRAFTADEIGLRPTFAAMHRGHLVISGGRFSTDEVGLGKLTTWRLSQSASPTLFGPSRVGVAIDDNIFKSHVLGFSGENCQIRAGKFTVYDLTNLAAPALKARANGGISSSHSSCWAGKYVYTGGEGYGTASGWIDVFDVSNPASPILVNSIDIPTLTGFRCASVYVLGNVMVVSASLTNGIATFNLSDPTNPQLINVFRGDAGANTYTSYLSGDRVYGGGQEGGLYIYDIADPAQIRLVSQFATGGTPRYPVLQDEFIHLGNLGNGRYQKIRIDTVPPQMVASVAMPIPAGAARASTEIAIPIGNLVFIGNSDTDVTHPTGWIIPHNTAPDTRPPAINAVRPKAGETNVGISSIIGVSFTDLLDTPSINASTITVRPVGGVAIGGVYSNMGGIVNFSPSNPLAPNTTYEIVVAAGGVRDTQGNAVPTASTFRFSTGSSVNALTQGLTLHYPLDEASGAVADDAAGTRNGTLTNFSTTPWINASAVGPRALSFDGLNDYIVTPALDLGQTFSISAYVMLPSGTGGLHTIVGNANGGYQAQGWKLFIYGSTDVSAGRVQLESGNGTIGNAANTAVGAFPFNKWVHIAATVDRAAGTARIWIDGRDLTVDSTVQNDFATSGVLNWGRMTSNAYFLNGKLDEARCYNRLLGASEIQQLRDLALAPRARWRLNNSGFDSTSNGRNLIFSSSGASFSSSSTAEGPMALNLDGINGAAQSPAIELGNSFTVSAWAKIASGTGGLKTIVANGPSGGIGNGWNLFVRGSTDAAGGQLQFETGNGTIGNEAHTAAGAFGFDRWTHVAVSVDRTAGSARIYLDGIDRTQDGAIRNDFLTNAAIHIGEMSNGAARLGGQLDDIQLLPRQLASFEIATLAVGKLTGYWPMDNSDLDDSGFERAITRGGAAGFSTDSFRGPQSLNHDGVDDFAFAPSYSLGNQFTISLWAKLPAGLPAGSHTLLANSNGGSTTNGFRWFVNSWATGDLALHFETANGSLSENGSAPAGTFVPGQWNHLVAVVNRAAGHLDLYVNRKKVTSDSSIRTDFANDLSLCIGRFAGGGALWQGQIDDVRVYNELISDADIAALGFGSINLAPAVNTLSSSNSAVTTGSSATFTAAATDQNVGEALQYSFNFGDGVATGWQSGNTASHSYVAPGRYGVTAFVTDGYTTSSRTMTEVVYNPLTAVPPSISSEIAYDGSRNKVWCVVPDGDDHDNNPATAPMGRVVRFDANSRAVDYRVNLGVDAEPVALALRPGNAEVWIACKRSGEIKVVDAGTGIVLATLSVGRGYLPVAVGFAPNGGAAFVACEGSESVQKWTPSTRLKVGELDLGAPPRGLAVASDSSRLFISRFRSPDPRAEVWECAASTLTLVRTIALNADSTTLDAANAARGVPNYLSQVVISPDGKKGWLPAKKDNIFRGQFRDGKPLNHENTVRSLVAQLDLVANAELSTNRIDLDNTGLPVAACFSPRGDLVFASIVANEQVAVIDANSRATLPAISTANTGQLVGCAPSGLCVSPDGSKLFVHNFLERKVRVFDVSGITVGTRSTAPLLGSVALTAVEPLASAVLRGKQLFYNSEDPRLAREGYISCASCHLGGDQDGRVWDLTQFGEGLRNTIDLRGHSGVGQGPLHWSANFDEIQDFENQIRSLSGGSGLMTSTPFPSLDPNKNAGRSADLDALAAYVGALTVTPKSPFRTPSGGFTAAALSGQTHFSNQACANCHGGANFTDSSLATFGRHDIGTLNLASGKRLGGTLDGLDTPTLRGIWTTAPYLHRGQSADLGAVFNPSNAPDGTAHARFRELTTTQQDELLRYLLELE